MDRRTPLVARRPGDLLSSRKPGNQDIYVVPAAGGIPRQLTTEPSNEFECSWSRDGRWIYFDSSRSGRSELWKTPAGGGPAIQVTRNGGLYGQEGPDGRFLFFTKGSVIEATSPGLWRIATSGLPPLDPRMHPNTLSMWIDRYCGQPLSGELIVYKPGAAIFREGWSGYLLDLDRQV